LVDET
jgi:hypothetical protein